MSGLPPVGGGHPIFFPKSKPEVINGIMMTRSGWADMDSIIDLSPPHWERKISYFVGKYGDLLIGVEKATAVNTTRNRTAVLIETLSTHKIATLNVPTDKKLLWFFPKKQWLAWEDSFIDLRTGGVTQFLKKDAIFSPSFGKV